MGLCLGTETTEEKKARIHSAKIDRDLYESAKREMNVVKILLLGEPDINLPVCMCACVCTGSSLISLTNEEHDKSPHVSPVAD